MKIRQRMPQSTPAEHVKPGDVVRFTSGELFLRIQLKGAANEKVMFVALKDGRITWCTPGAPVYPVDGEFIEQCE